MIDPTRYAQLQLAVTDDGARVDLRFEHGKANEVGSAVLRELAQLADDLAGDADARALVSTSTRVTSRGTPIFVAGADVTERVGWTDDDVVAHVAWQRDVLAAIRDVPVFHVAVVAGVALGWGTEWLLTADVRLSAEGARFGLPETGLGILPGAGGTAALAAEIGLPQALRLGMTGEIIEGPEAVRIGLVQEHHATHADAMARAHALAAKAATRSPTANAAFKAAARAALGQPDAARRGLEAAAYAHCVRSGEAAIGRANFTAIRAGETPPWGPRTSVPDGDSD